MKCPYCARKVKQSTLLFPGEYHVRCDCGTRIYIRMGMIFQKIVDYELPEENVGKHAFGAHVGCKWK